MAVELDWDPLTIFGATAVLMFLGFAGNLIFSKLRFNDTLLLIGVGVFLGPVSGIIPAAAVEPVRALVGPLALILILFDGGLALRFHDLRTGLLSATIMALLGFTLTAGFAGAVTAIVLEIPFTTGLILGAILGGTSALVVLPSLQHMKTEPKTATTLNLESALTDVLVVVVSFTLISIVALGQGLDAQDVASKIVITFAMSILLGALGGLLWLWLVPHVREKEYGYMVTLGVMFGLYVLVEWLLQDVSSGGGPLAVLAFGTLLGNTDNLASLGQRAGNTFAAGMKRFQGEIAFLVRTFFFVYLGILVEPSLFTDFYTIAFGIVLFAVMVGVRYVVVALMTGTPKLRGDGRVLWVMMPRGLAAAVLAAIPASAPFEIPGTDRFVAIAFMILVLSNVMSSVGAFVLEKGDARDPGSRLAKAAKKEQKKPAKKRATKAKSPAKKPASKAAKKPAKKAAKPPAKATKRAKSAKASPADASTIAKEVDMHFQDADAPKTRKHPRRKDAKK